MSDEFRLLAECQNPRQLQLLFSNGKDIEARNSRHETPLMAAIASVDSQLVASIVKTLISLGADTNVRNGLRQTPFMYTCIMDYPEVAFLLLQKEGTDINAQDNKGMTGLMFACQLNNVDMVELILKLHASGQQKVDLSLRNLFGRTALEEAIEKRSAETIAMLSRLKKNELRKQYSDYGNNPKRKVRKSEDVRPLRPKSEFDSYRTDVVKSVSCDSLTTSVDTNALHHYKRELADEFVKLSDKPDRTQPDSNHFTTDGINKPSRDNEQEKQGEVGDLVLAVRQCAADIRQICKDYDIDYSKETNQPHLPVVSQQRNNRRNQSDEVDTEIHGSDTKGKRSSRSSGSVAQSGVVDLLSRRHKKNAAKRKERHQDLAQLVNTLVMSGAKNDSGFRESRDNKTCYGDHERKLKSPHITENSIDSRSGRQSELMATNSISVTKLTANPRSSNALVHTSRNNSRDTYSAHSISPDQKRLCERPMVDKVIITPSREGGMAGGITLQVPIEQQALNSTGYFRQGKPKKSKKHRKKKEKSQPKEKAAKNGVSNDNKHVPVELISDSKHLEPLKWRSFKDPLPSIPCSSNMKTHSGVCLPPLRESLRYTGSARPVKLQTLDRDLWRIIEASNLSKVKSQK
ncbi:POTE ankyrin domain family member B-like [Argopecten irradians]|uniref:POTE ankyrin domain family member B-like n=1 Tax=Argopecten irradians TaxID=31199 RepID=UPI00371A9E0F